MLDYWHILPQIASTMAEEKLEFLQRSKYFWNPGKTQAWEDMGIDLVIDRRIGYYLYDLSGHRLIDVLGLLLMPRLGKAVGLFVAIAVTLGIAFNFTADG